ncbi:effector-associated constant component EACC1 [Streptomyces luteogriseus]|uniref:effector-associated constant component EACC1 n=1 Tax=Streptomyces luteogriseus TaxID=68233 RepID=UPI003698FB8B
MNTHGGRFQLRAEIGQLDDFDALESWHNWLAGDPDLVDIPVTTQKSHQPEGEMAGWFDVTIALANQATALGSLVLAYLTWRSTQLPEDAQRVTVVIEDGDRRITITNMSDNDVRNVIDSWERQSSD